MTRARKASASRSASTRLLALAAHLDHREFALDRRARHGHVDHAMHRHQPLELVLDLLDHHRRAGVTMVMRDRCFACSVSDTVSLSIL